MGEKLDTFTRMKKSLFVCSVFLLILNVTPAFAVASFWSCNLIAELNGVPSSFLYHNKDSWEGSGKISCQRHADRIEEEVTVQYEGWASATGLASRSRLTFFSYFIPTHNPSEILKVFATSSMGEIPMYFDHPVTTVLQVGRNRPFEVAVRAHQSDQNLSIPLNYGTMSISRKNNAPKLD